MLGSGLMLILYDRETSGNAYKVRLLLALLDVPYQRIAIELRHGKNVVDAHYRRLNPRGQVPTLIHDGEVLWGSTAGLCYVAARLDPARTWLPPQPLVHARIMQWLELAQNEVQSGLFLARAIARFGYPGSLAEAQSKAQIALQAMEWRLEQHAWLVSPGPTIADIACFPYAALAEEGQVSLAGFPGVRRWIAATKVLPSFVGMPGL